MTTGRTDGFEVPGGDASDVAQAAEFRERIEIFMALGETERREPAASIDAGIEAVRKLVSFSREHFPDETYEFGLRVIGTNEQAGGALETKDQPSSESAPAGRSRRTILEDLTLIADVAREGREERAVLAEELGSIAGELGGTLIEHQS